jgi:hypothetical protein
LRKAVTDSITTKLVDIFGRLEVSEIENAQSAVLLDAFGKGSLSEVAAISGYQAVYAHIKNIKMQLEELAGRYPGHHEQQVKQCLRRMEDARREYEAIRLRLLGDLIQRWFIDGERWTDDAKDLYNKVSLLITDWQDYFLSYTNRGAPAINNDFRDLIEYNFGKKLSGLMTTENCVARVIVKYLSDHGGRGFFDAADLRCGEDIEDKIRRHCTRAFAMIQFIEHQSFVDPGEGRRNWCYEEYLLFREAFGWLQRYLPPDNRDFENYFIITPPVADTGQLFPAAALPYYKSWLDDVGRKNAIRLKNKKIAGLWEDFSPLSKEYKYCEES